MFSTFSVIEERLSKTALGICLIPVTMAVIMKTNDKNAGEDVGKEELLFTADWNLHCFSYYGVPMKVVQKLKAELS